MCLDPPVFADVMKLIRDFEHHYNPSDVFQPRNEILLMSQPSLGMGSKRIDMMIRKQAPTSPVASSSVNAYTKAQASQVKTNMSDRKLIRATPVPSMSSSSSAMKDTTLMGRKLNFRSVMKVRHTNEREKWW